jgi:hypothetical protein
VRQLWFLTVAISWLIAPMSGCDDPCGDGICDRTAGENSDDCSTDCACDIEVIAIEVTSPQPISLNGEVEGTILLTNHGPAAAVGGYAWINEANDPNEAMDKLDGGVHTASVEIETPANETETLEWTGVFMDWVQPGEVYFGVMAGAFGDPNPGNDYFVLAEPVIVQ